MSITKIEQTQSIPVDDNSWERLYETDKFYNLGINQPVDYNFDSNTIKKGVIISIGGSNYQCIADTAISGTASDYVKITSAGIASYVSSLTGVSWNDTYNFYADSSGNAYIFNEPKALYGGSITEPKTKLGKFSEHAYFKLLDIKGIATFESDAITMYQPVTMSVGKTLEGVQTDTIPAYINLRNTTDANMYLQSSSINGLRNICMNVTHGNVLIGTTTDNGVDKLQVAGSIYASGDLTIDGDTTVEGLTVNGYISGYEGELDIYADITVNGLTVSGDTTVEGLTVNGNIYGYEDELNINADVTIDNLIVNGDTTVEDLEVNGNISASDDVLTIQAAEVSISDALAVNGNILPTATPTTTTTTTLTADGSTYTLPRGIYINMRLVVEVTASNHIESVFEGNASAEIQKKDIDGNWTTLVARSPTDSTPAGTVASSDITEVYISTGSNMRITNDYGSNTSGGYVHIKTYGVLEKS